MKLSQPATIFYTTLGRATWWGTKRVVKRRVKSFRKDKRSLPTLGAVIGTVAVSAVAVFLLANKAGTEQNGAAQ